MFKYFKNLIKTGTGHSSKAFFLVAVTVMGCYLLFVLSGVLLYDCATDGTVDTPLGGIAEVIAAITALLGSAGACKVFSDVKGVDSEPVNYEEEC